MAASGSTEAKNLLKVDEDGQTTILLPEYQHQPLDFDTDEQRFLILQPCSGNKADPDNHVRCSLVKQSLSDMDADPFIAVKNSRSYRLMGVHIEVDGKALLVPAAVEVFLRHYRDSHQPVRLWIRHVCLVEPDAQERTIYWTRDFIDTMYDLASGTVDMNEYLTEMVDRGEHIQVYTQEHRMRRREWNQIDKTLASPKTFPNRLGFRPSPTQVMDFYPYVPLDVVADEIRVLVIAPAQDSTTPIVTGMAHCLHYSTFYHALSYTWGSDEPTSSITMNGQLVKIRPNLELALRAMRSPHSDVVVWIDALCIDQSNLRERNRQLARIETVYDYASVVVSYVGELDEDSSKALDFIPALQVPMARREDNGNWATSREVDPAAIPGLCAALYRFLSRPYFSRIWILQELSVASVASVMCGKRVDVTFEQVYRASSILASMLDRDPSLVQAVDPSYYRKQDAATDPLTYLTKIHLFRTMLSGGMSVGTAGVFLHSQQHHDMWKQNAPGYLEALIWARDWAATDAHDKIFALWNLATDKANLEYSMNYADSVTKSYTDFVKAWSKQHGILDIITAAERNDRSAFFYKGASSWCPDWSIPSTASSLIRKERLPNLMWPGKLVGKLYSADGDVKQTEHQEFFTFDGNTLNATGIILDRIKLVFDETETPPTDTIQPAYFRDGHLGAKVVQYFYDNDIQTYDEPAQAYMAMRHGDVPSAWPTPADHPSAAAKSNSNSDSPDAPFICDLDRSRHVKAWDGGLEHGYAPDVIRHVLRGRIPFVTDDGYMGLAPRWVRDHQTDRPWVLAILAGCSVPIMLLENEDGSYAFGGACFVQGWMEGEHLGQQFGVDDFTEFWTTMRESSMLRLV